MPEITSLGFGIGLRAVHVADILQSKPKVDWFEILSENYMNTRGAAWNDLLRIRADYPLVAHGVSLSIAGSDALDMEYLAALKTMADELSVAYVSDHLCWTGTGGINTHDLLPVPYTKEALAHVAARIHTVQEYLKRPLVLENPSTYVEFTASEMPEAVFLKEMARQTGCLLLLDVNNIYVSAFNHGWNEEEYLAAIPPEHVAYMHLAGHDHQGTHIIDTHDHPVADDVWELYRKAVPQLPKAGTLIEWDDKIPPLATLLAELETARTIAKQHEKLRTAS